jgi:hypothetical protein
MLVSWHDLGCPEKAGDYAFKDILIRVDEVAISTWRAEPGAVFHVETHAPGGGVGCFVLGRWEMPDDPEGAT